MGCITGAPSANPASSPRKVGQPSADRARIAGMTSGALPLTRPRVWDTSGATPHAARVALECALESVWTVPTDGGLDTKLGINDSKTCLVRAAEAVPALLLLHHGGWCAWGVLVAGGALVGAGHAAVAARVRSRCLASRRPRRKGGSPPAGRVKDPYFVTSTQLMASNPLVRPWEQCRKHLFGPCQPRVRSCYIYIYK